MATQLTPVQEKELLIWLKAQGRQFSRSLSALLLISLVLFVLRVGAMWSLSLVLHQVLIEQQSPSLSVLASLAALFVGQSLLVYCKGHQGARVEQAISSHYQQAIYQQIRRFHLALLRQQPTANWQAHLMKRSPAISQYYLDFQLQQKLASIAPLIVLAIVLPLNWLIALILLVSAPLIPVFMWITGMGAATAHRANFAAIDRLNHLFLDRLRGRQLLQLFNREQAELEKFSVAGEELKSRTLKVVRLAFLSASVLDFFATVAMALVAVLVGFTLLGEVNTGHWGEQPLNFQQGLFLLLMTPLFFNELKLLGRHYHTKSEAIGAAAEIRPLLELVEQPHPTQAHDEAAIEWPSTEIFGANGDAILKAEGFHFAKGDKVFLKGPSGSGKSVLLEALLGLRKLAPVSPCLQREDVAWLGQQTHVLPGSVRQNLTLGEPFEDEALLEALEKVGLTEWLHQQPEGLEQAMGEHPPLSGGQTQRLALARILLFDKPVVLLDEPTAHLTQDQHHELSALLQQQLEGKSVVWVSHREVTQAWFTQQWHLQVIDGLAFVSTQGGAQDD